MSLSSNFSWLPFSITTSTKPSYGYLLISPVLLKLTISILISAFFALNKIPPKFVIGLACFSLLFPLSSFIKPFIPILYAISPLGLFFTAFLLILKTSVLGEEIAVPVSLDDIKFMKSYPANSFFGIDSRPYL